MGWQPASAGAGLGPTVEGKWAEGVGGSASEVSLQGGTRAKAEFLARLVAVGTRVPSDGLRRSHCEEEASRETGACNGLPVSLLSFVKNNLPLQTFNGYIESAFEIKCALQTQSGLLGKTNLATFAAKNVLTSGLLFQPGVRSLLPGGPAGSLVGTDRTRWGPASCGKVTFAWQRMNNCILYYFQME